MPVVRVIGNSIKLPNFSSMSKQKTQHFSQDASTPSLLHKSIDIFIYLFRDSMRYFLRVFLDIEFLEIKFWNKDSLIKRIRNSLQKCSKKTIKISQYSQENTCVGVSFLIKFQLRTTPSDGCDLRKTKSRPSRSLRISNCNNRISHDWGTGEMV